jgi:streptomycin 6-kinase
LIVSAGDQGIETLIVDICHRYELDLVTVCSGNVGSIIFVARVRDRAGQTWILKKTSIPRGSGEAAALRAWRETDRAARLVAELEPGVYLIEWLRGPSIANLSPLAPFDIAAVGRMLRGLHSVAVPRNLGSIRRFFLPKSVEHWRMLTPEMISVGTQVATTVHEHSSASDVVLHGDLFPANVILTDRGPKVIDPLGYHGPAAWDIATLAVTAAARGRPNLLGGLLDGYGAEPPLMAEVFAWMVLAYLQRNLAEGRTEFVENLRPLAERLVTSGDAAGFLGEYRTWHPDRRT